MREELPFACDTNYYYFLNGLKTRIESGDTQLVGLLTGAVGSGKSCRAQEILYFINRDNCDISQIAFDSEELVKAVLNNSKRCIISDEGRNTISSLEVMTKDGRLINSLFDQARTKNLIILICIPRISNVQKDILQIADFCIHVWETISPAANGRKRILKGNMALYIRPQRFGLEGLDSLELFIRYSTIKRKDPTKFIPIPKPALTQKGSEFIPGEKGGFYAVPEEDYKDKKVSILKKFLKEESKRPTKKYNFHYDKAMLKKMIKAGIPLTRIAKALDISVRTCCSFKEQMREGLV